MKAEELITLYSADGLIKTAFDRLTTPSPQHIQLKGLIGSSDALVAAAVFRLREAGQFFILHDKEEAFYFLAPLFFIAAFMIIGSRPRLKNRRVAVVMSLLLFINILLPIIGQGFRYLSIVTGWSQPFGFMYAGSPFTEFAYTTIFYRIFDFSVGICLAYVFRHSHLFSSVNAHRRMAATALSIASIGGLMLSASLMNAAGGVYTSGFVFEYLAAVSAGLLILSLTEPTTWLYNFLSRPLYVYLGRISYALYLIQMAPFTGNLLDLMYINALDMQLGRVLFAYIRLNIISALLYETVEKYGSRLVLRLSRMVTRKASPVFIKKSEELKV